MEDYTYHFEPNNEMVLGSHMLEICESIAANKPSCEIHPLGIGGKGDPVRLVFNVAAGAALNASLIDMGNRFRLLVNTVTAVSPKFDLPKLPVARVLWKPHPSMHDALAAWIYAGGAHHTCYSQNLSAEYLQDFAQMAVQVLGLRPGFFVRSLAKRYVKHAIRTKSKSGAKMGVIMIGWQGPENNVGLYYFAEVGY